MAEKENKPDGKHSVTVRLEDETFQEIGKMAKEDERSVAAFVERHLRKSFQPRTSTGVKSDA